MKKKLIFLFFISFAFGSTFAKEKIDSIEKLTSSLAGLAKIQAYNLLAEKYYNLNLRKSLDYADSAYNLTLTGSNEYEKARALINKANVVIKSIENKSGVKLYQQALAIYKKINSRNDVAKTLNHIGYTMISTQNYNQGYSYFLDAMKIYESENDFGGIARVYYNFGVIYGRWQIYDKALESFNMAKKYYLQNKDKSGYAETLLGIADLYRLQGKNSSVKELLLSAIKLLEESGNTFQEIEAYRILGDYYWDAEKNFTISLKYLNMAVLMAEKVGDKPQIASYYSNIAFLYSQNGNFQLSLANNLKSIKIREELGWKIMSASSMINIGKDYIDLKEYPNAKKWLDSGLKIANEMSALAYQKRGYTFLYELYIKTNDSRNAIQTLNSLLDIAERFRISERIDKTTAIRLQNQLFEFERKDLHNKKDQFQIYLILSIIIFIFAIITIFIFYFSLSYKKKSLNRLTIQQNEIQSQEHFIEKITSTVPTIIFIFDISLRRNIYRNINIAAVLGYKESLEQIDINYIMSLCHPEDLPAFQTFMEDVGEWKDDKEVKVLISRLKDASGNWRWFQSRNVVFSRNYNGVPVQILTSILEISDLKISENKLREQNQYLRMINELSFKLASVKDTDELFRTIAYGLKEITGAIGVFVNSFYPDEGFLKPKFIASSDFLQTQVNGILGKNIFDLKFPVDDSAKEFIINSTVLMSDDLNEISFGSIPKAVAQILKYSLSLGPSVGISLSFERELFGTATLFFNNKQTITDTELLKIIGMIAGVSIKRKQAEESLIASEFKYRQLINESGVGVFIYQDGVFKYCNEKFAFMFGYEDANSMINTKFSKLVENNYKPIVESNLARVLTGSVPRVNYSFKGVKANGKIVDFEVIHSRINFDGDKKAIQGILYDLSEKKKAEKQLKDSEILYNTLIETSPDGIFLTDLTGKIITCNNRIAEMWGYDYPQELNGIQSLDFIIPEQRERAYKLVEETLVTGNLNNIEFTHIRKDGVKFDVELNAKLLRDSSGSPKSFIGIIRDITERKKSDEAINLLSRLQSIGNLASGISQNFKNFLSSMLLNLNLAKVKKVNIEKYFNNIERVIFEADRLATRYETFASGGEPVKFPFKPDVIKNTVLKMLSEKNIDFDFSAQENFWLIKGDAKQIIEVFTNLTNNSLEAMPEGGTISVSIENFEISNNFPFNLNSGKYIRITFSDNGKGIPSQIVDKIFDPFFSTKTEGIGLGLTTAYYIIQKHEGLIRVESPKGKGTNFTIILPATDSINDEKNIPVKYDTKLPEKKYRIFLMDDDTDIRETMSEILELNDYEFFVAENGEQAISEFENAKRIGKPYDIAILDLTIQGGRGGEEVLKDLRKIDENIKAIIFSGHSALPIISNYQEFGFQGILKKPVSMNDITEIIRKVISS